MTGWRSFSKTRGPRCRRRRWKDGQTDLALIVRRPRPSLEEERDGDCDPKRRAPEIEHTLTIHADPERVYAAITEPVQVTTWLAMRATGEPAVGEGLLLDFEFDDASRNHMTRGTYKTMQPGSRLAYT